MFFIFSKILQFLISPIIWVFILLLFSAFYKSSKKKKRFLLIGMGVLYFFSNSFILDEAFRVYEERNQNFNTIQNHDIAIVLGGFTSYDSQSEMEQFHLSTDRFLHSLQLYKLGKVKKIMLVGGSGSIAKPNEKEGLILERFLIKMGVPKKDIIVESESKNTRENAVNSAQIINENYPNSTCVLVTSGYHMPRAERCFKKVGLTVTPFSVDHYSGERKYLFDHLFIPNSFTLLKWNMLIHEWVGFLSYKIMGYV